MRLGQHPVDQVIRGASYAFEDGERRVVGAQSIHRVRFVRVVDAAACEVVGEITVRRRLFQAAVEGDNVLGNHLWVARQPDVDRDRGLRRLEPDNSALLPAIRRPDRQHDPGVLAS